MKGLTQSLERRDNTIATKVTKGTVTEGVGERSLKDVRVGVYLGL